VLALVHLRPCVAVGDTGAVALENQVITAGDANRSYLLAEPPPDAPVSAVVMSLHGTSSTADRQARLSGFEDLTHTAGAVVVFPEAIQPALTNGITDPRTEVAVSPTLTRTTYGAEGQTGEVTLLTSRKARHTWPGGHLGLLLGLFLGRTSREIDATKSIWEFGLRHAGDP
jgi:poly(3-hydroxybutyrate) depolymerase